MLREVIGDALRFWEPMRVIYNFVLAGVVIATLGPRAVVLMPPHLLGFFAFSAVVANVLYCAAYPIDIFVSMSDLRDRWLNTMRYAVWAVGTATAIYLTVIVAIFGPLVDGD